MNSNVGIPLGKRERLPEALGVKVAIVDFGMGNLFSIRQACEHVGLQAVITHEAEELLAAHGLILPGVGAFGDAMQHLEVMDLIGPIKDFAASGRPFLGICLGMQLLATESEEFGRHRGLDMIPGSVVRLPNMGKSGERIKVPQVGWNHISAPAGRDESFWTGTPLEGLAGGEYMYFVHSYRPIPADPDSVLCVTEYGGFSFASGLARGNVSAFQFHPEKSGPRGLKIYENWASRVKEFAREEANKERSKR
jgi:glutamine amidotransferase